MEFIGPSVDVTEAMAESCGGFDSESVPLDEGGVSLTGDVGESRSLEPDDSFVRFFLRNPSGMGAAAPEFRAATCGFPAGRRTRVCRSWTQAERCSKVGATGCGRWAAGGREGGCKGRMVEQCWTKAIAGRRRAQRRATVRGMRVGG